MIRIVIENVFFFLLPTLAYLLWIAFKRNDWPGVWPVLKDAPLTILFVLGASLMLTTLVAFSSRSHNQPGETYAPPVFRDGQLEPGHKIPSAK